MSTKCEIKEADNLLKFKNRFNSITFDVKKGIWSIEDRITQTLVIKNAGFRIDKAENMTWEEAPNDISWSKKNIETVFGKGMELKITFSPLEGYNPIRILFIRLYNNQPFIEIGWGVKNQFNYPVRIKVAEVLYGGELFKGQKVEDPRVLKSGAGAEPNMVEKTWQVEADNGAMLTYKNRGARRSIVAGGLCYSEFARRIEILDGQKKWGGRGTANIQNKGFKNINLACSDPQGKIILSGTTYISSDSTYLDVVTSDPFEACEAYGLALRKANNADPNTYDFPTLCGWMVSTKHLGESKPINNSAGLVEQTEIARERGFMSYSPLAVRLEPDTYCFKNNGDTQQGWWDNEHWRMYGPGGGSAPYSETGSLCKPYDTFAKFCKAVSEMGGIPFTYFQSSMPSNDFAAAHPEWMLNNDISQLHLNHAHQRPLVRYDFTDPGFRKHCLKVWKRLRKAGLKGVKFDYPETAWARGGGFEDNSFTTASAYCELYRLCRKGLGKDAYIHERNLGGPAHENVPRLDITAGTVDLQRVWGDASHFEPEMASRMGLRWYKSRSVFIYYPDGKSFFENGKPLPSYKRRAFLTLIAFLGGRLEIGTSIGSMTDEMFHDTTRLYPVFKGIKSPRPVDMLMGKKHPEVYDYEVTPEWHQVVLINNNKRAKKNISVPFSGSPTEDGALGLDSGSSYHIFDFWNQSYLGKYKGNTKLSVNLRGGEAAMLSVRKVISTPQIISTNRHIMQGMVECHDVKCDVRKKTISGKVDVVGGEPFILTIACNETQISSCKGAELKKRKDGKDLINLVFSSETNKRMAFELSFK